MTGKIRVVFVDDESHILRGIRRSMAEMEDEWEMAFCGSGEEALALFRQNPFDIIVSDMRMSGMDGAQLLQAVRGLYPATIRVILSGYADADSVLRTVGPAHIYLAKPCDAGVLREAIRRQTSLRGLLESPGMRATLVGLTNLPSLPQVYIQLQAELLSPRNSAKSIAAIIEQDMAMTAAILKLTNSAYFSTAGRVSTPLHAVLMLGIETVQALVLKVGVFRQFSGKPAMAPLLKSLTNHSLAISDLAEGIAGTEGGDTVQGKGARIAAMLADIGCLVLFDAHPDEYRSVLLRVGPGKPLHVAEEEAFSASHALIGAYLLGLWGFSEDIVEAVAYCSNPGASSGRDNLVLTAVHAARVLGPFSPLLPADRQTGRSLDMAYLADAKRDINALEWCKLAEAKHYEV